MMMRKETKKMMMMKRESNFCPFLSIESFLEFQSLSIPC